MVFPLSSNADNYSETTTKSLENHEVNIHNNEVDDIILEEVWESEADESICEEDYNSESDSQNRDYSQNQVLVTFSWSLMNQLRQLSRSEGIEVEHLLTELVAEGVTKRAFEDQTKAPPSHLMTRNGYVHNNSDGNSSFVQPQLSHHNANNNRPNNGQNMRNKPGVPARNNQYNNTPRYQGRNNYSNGNNAQAPVPFRQNRANYNPQQRTNARAFAQNSQSNQTPRFNQEIDETNPNYIKNKKY